ncbi:hypothetical protein Oweho_3133 [Owenweeksia hongkongensis DSM 17368]|uniref:Secretion system C-terminal sorting domain-containing protein n=1 Tax=Owenweeksia hongkongensis (strain DSM 17368 / CIP 108786 / JCM 12287 / NRRL B-23963 / UST20020801) TaxID=926562 RepID=G8R361_OWEHD|nr:T9SS type A sorting domain-containing protein [Owenweeksia hongkongensis]AEV34086.1 hypothetical protein Oweho_3133 [Owenweeksia hongkongensis DSM 17368]
MLRKLLFATAALLSLNSYSQCIADAGPDQHWCGALGGYSMPSLGNTPSASNGQAPYIYEWSIDPISISPTTTFFTSIFLDDTTSSNPQLIDFWGREITFFLKVTDANSSVCFDTVTVTSSTLTQHTDGYFVTINAGDSVKLYEPNVWSMFPIDSVLWRPNHGLTDSNAYRPWAKPTKDIVYYSTIWDSKGCTLTGTPFLYVFVNHLGNSEFEESQIDIYPTLLKAGESLTIHLSQNLFNARVEIHDLSGRKVFSAPLENKKSEFVLSSLPKGVYLCSISTEGKVITQKKIVLE